MGANHFLVEVADTPGDGPDYVVSADDRDADDYIVSADEREADDDQAKPGAQSYRYYSLNRISFFRR